MNGLKSDKNLELFNTENQKHLNMKHLILLLLICHPTFLIPGFRSPHCHRHSSHCLRLLLVWCL